jgi:uncharacterized protein (DUF1015 family)
VADVQPFRGLRYNLERIEEGISSVISPPYDVISPDGQRFYHEQSPYNVIRLELGEERATDSQQDNKYTRAASTLKDWLKDNILVHEPVPAFYAIEHRFNHKGVGKHRWGLTARVRLGDPGTTGARPHETIMETRVSDRLQLLRSCRVNVSPILGMVRHDGGGGLVPLLSGLVTGDPAVTAVDHQGVTHNLWVITDNRSIGEISRWCAGRALYIADGHHRYQTAVAYQEEQRANRPASTGDEAYNFAMMNLIDADDAGTVALPAHRLVRLTGPAALAGLRDSLVSLFDVEYLEPAGTSQSDRLETVLDILENRGRERITIGVYGLEAGRFCLLTPRQKAKVDSLLPPERSREWRELDVAVLHWIILGQLIGVDTPEKEEECLKYTQDAEEAIARVDSGEYGVAFLMSPIPVSSILAVADAGDRMPPKSTYFYPKLPTGLVMYPLWED